MSTRGRGGGEVEGGPLTFSSMSNFKCSTMSANCLHDLRSALTPSSSSRRSLSSIASNRVSCWLMSTSTVSSAFLDVALTLSAIWLVCSEVMPCKDMMDVLHNFNTSKRFIGFVAKPADAATVIWLDDRIRVSGSASTCLRRAPNLSAKSTDLFSNASNWSLDDFKNKAISALRISIFVTTVSTASFWRCNATVGWVVVGEGGA